MNEHKEDEKTRGDLKEAVSDKADAEQRIANARAAQAERAQGSANGSKEEAKSS